MENITDARLIASFRYDDWDENKVSQVYAVALNRMVSEALSR